MKARLLAASVCLSVGLMPPLAGAQALTSLASVRVMLWGAAGNDALSGGDDDVSGLSWIRKAAAAPRAPLFVLAASSRKAWRC